MDRVVFMVLTFLALLALLRITLFIMLPAVFSIANALLSAIGSDIIEAVLTRIKLRILLWTMELLEEFCPETHSPLLLLSVLFFQASRFGNGSVHLRIIVQEVIERLVDRVPLLNWMMTAAIALLYHCTARPSVRNRATWRKIWLRQTRTAHRVDRVMKEFQIFRAGESGTHDQRMAMDRHRTPGDLPVLEWVNGAAGLFIVYRRCLFQYIDRLAVRLACYLRRVWAPAVAAVPVRLLKLCEVMNLDHKPLKQTSRKKGKKAMRLGVYSRRVRTRSMVATAVTLLKLLDLVDRYRQHLHRTWAEHERRTPKK